MFCVNNQVHSEVPALLEEARGRRPVRGVAGGTSGDSAAGQLIAAAAAGSAILGIKEMTCRWVRQQQQQQASSTIVLSRAHGQTRATVGAQPAGPLMLLAAGKAGQARSSR